MATATKKKADAKTSASKGTSPSAKQLQPTSAVERHFLERSGRQFLYTPTEKTPIIEVGTFPDLGRLTALRFLEWVQDNPDGVVSLPTGKTPEYFIKWTKHYLGNWSKKDVQNELAEIGFTNTKKPELRGLHFVQIDEFYPIDPHQHNSFFYYVKKHYLRGFGLDPKRALLIDPTSIGVPEGKTLDDIFPNGRVDLSLRSHNATTYLEKLQQRVIVAVDQFCTEYEERIRDLGGIGFFLGGIGPDGHIGFNPRGSHHLAPTRLTYTNYETEAAAASDLGGIEVSRNRPVITIGLATIRYKPEATVLIFAAGEGKSRVVADAIQQDRHVLYPASVMQGMPNARFYLTHGATIRLEERVYEDLAKAAEVSEEHLQREVINRTLELKVRLEQLSDKDAAGSPRLKLLCEKSGASLTELANRTREALVQRIRRGMTVETDQTILHTGPHHDDIMLGYMPYIQHLVQHPSNKNYFNVLTSGFTAVTNKFLAEVFNDTLEFLEVGAFHKDREEGAFEADNDTARAEDVYRFLDGIAAKDERARRMAQARRMLYNLSTVYFEEDFDNLKDRIKENLHYLETQYPGKKDIELIQKLKGMQREYEEELIWGYVGTNPSDVFHSRLGFYTGDIFTEQPTQSRDVVPMLELLRKLQPTIVSITTDPEGAGPDTHYKVLQVLHEALIQYRDKTGKAPTIWGYRNVWYRWHPAEANVYVPASLSEISTMIDSFMYCFGSQKNASFPSYDYDGPFCDLAARLWVEQFQMLFTCLGERFFTGNPDPRLRSASGFVFFKEMALDEFSGQARRLAAATENVGT